MFRQTPSLCLLFVSCVMTQQNATFWGLCTQGAITPKFEHSAEIFVQCTYPTSYIILWLLVRKLSCWQTNKHTQTNRHRWKHPTLFAMLRRWAKKWLQMWSNNSKQWLQTHSQLYKLLPSPNPNSTLTLTWAIRLRQGVDHQCSRQTRRRTEVW